MKFVKGDAVAGLIIIAINMVGGIAIGTLQRGMTAADAVERYTLLTIGDGLVSQIPALFISITAGFIVTRVASEENKDLGSDIISQLVHEPKALMITSVILTIFAVVPGFPTIVFLSLAVATGGGAFIITRGRKITKAAKRATEMPSFAPALSPKGPKPSFPKGEAEDHEPVEAVTFALTVPLIVDIASSIRDTIRPEKLDREVARVRRALNFDLGVPFPGIHLRLNDTLKDGEYRILVNEIPVAAGGARPGAFIVRETEANLKMFDIPYERGPDFLPNTPSLWVQVKHLPVVERAGIQVMTLSSMRLVSEEISIRDMRTVLEALVEWGQREKDPIVLVEHVRSALARYITHRFSGGQNLVPAYLISKEIEDAVRGAVRQTSGASYLALSPDVHRQIVASMKAAIGTEMPAGPQPVMLAPMDIRRFMRKIAERDFPNLAVLSYQELTPAANIQPLERIKLTMQLAQG